MDLVTILVTIIIFLLATTICVIFSDRLGLGSVVGFIVAGVLIGPSTPLLTTFHDVDALQSISELGVVLFMFTVGLEMRPQKIWAMRVQLFGLGVGQVLLSAVALGLFFWLAMQIEWQSAVLLGLGLAMSSTAVVMTILGDRGDLTTPYGQNSFAILMAQDICIVPVMALIPLLSPQAATDTGTPLLVKLLLMLGAFLGIFIGGQYVIPNALNFVAKKRDMQSFGLVIFLGILSAAWTMELVGISMDLGAFCLGVLLSGSTYRYQVAALVDPFKQTLMGLFFISVGMSINIDVFFAQWPQVLALVTMVMLTKIIVLVWLSRFFKTSQATRIRTGFALCQVGEFTFVLFSIAKANNLMSDRGLSIGFLVISLSMMVTPLMIKLGDRIASRFQPSTPDLSTQSSDQELKNHLVIIGLDTVGQIMSFVTRKADVPYICIDKDIKKVQDSIHLGIHSNFGDMMTSTAQEIVNLSKAKAVFISSIDFERVKAIAISLKNLYPHLVIHARVHTLEQKTALESHGIIAVDIFVESTLSRGERLLKDLSVPEDQAQEVIESLHKNNYALIQDLFTVSKKSTI